VAQTKQIAEAISCKLSGHTICVLCGACVDCTIVESYESVGHIRSAGLKKYRCNATYLQIVGDSRNFTREEVKNWWSRG